MLVLHVLFYIGHQVVTLVLLCVWSSCLQDKQVLEDLVANISMNIEVPDSAEDCLYLNIYTPSKPGANDKLPVSVNDLVEHCCFFMHICFCFLILLFF